MIVEALLDSNAYEEAANMYMAKIKAEKQTSKGYREQVLNKTMQDCLIVVIMAILQRDLKRAEELNYDMMGLYYQFLSRV